MTRERFKIAIVVGTRPDAIKLAPVYLEIAWRQGALEPVLISTGQHREILDQVLDTFDIFPDVDLDVMQPRQSPFEVTAQILTAIRPALERLKPDLLLVQGDTTTAFAAALAAFYLRIPIAHVEAGLRTFDKYQPFPEEKNRQMVSVLADMHFAPTTRARENLLREGITPEAIHVTGNTVIDALLDVAARGDEEFIPGLDLGDGNEARILLVTAHRRENWGPPLKSICGAIKDVVLAEPDVHVAVSVHPNPAVTETVRGELAGIPRVALLAPLAYTPFVQLMKRSYLILTDSGGIQEEAPSLGKPVLVLRNTTERPEGIEAGTLRIAGTDRFSVAQMTLELLRSPTAYAAMAQASNPYGDGRASWRIANLIEAWLGVSTRHAEVEGAR